MSKVKLTVNPGPELVSHRIPSEVKALLSTLVKVILLSLSCAYYVGP